jgi:hypothetical protein
MPSQCNYYCDSLAQMTLRHVDPALIPHLRRLLRSHQTLGLPKHSDTFGVEHVSLGYVHLSSDCRTPASAKPFAKLPIKASLGSAGPDITQGQPAAGRDLIEGPGDAGCTRFGRGRL